MSALSVFCRNHLTGTPNGKRRNHITVLLSAYLLSVVITALSFSVGYAQSAAVPADTTIVSDTTTASTDTSQNSISEDVLNSPVAFDSSAIIAARITDSINNPQQMDTARADLPFRFAEYAAALALSSQRAQKKSINNSHYHDAGDFVRADRSFFTVDYLTTPARHTVSAFGITGPRVTPIFDGRALTPLEHLPEQDGLIDFNDVPTAAVSDVYTITGPLAVFLGGQSGVAGIWLQKLRADGPRAESRLEVQKGPFGYAYTKGIISETLPNGFSYTAALGFRKTSLSTLLGTDDANHQFWEIESPYKNNWRITTSLRLYRRNAELTYKSQSLALIFNRDRRDQDMITKVERIVDGNNSLSVEFRHQRSESGSNVLGLTYSQQLDKTDNAFEAIWNHRGNASMLALTVRGTREKLEFDQGSNERNRGIVSLKGVLRLGGDNFSEVELPVAAVHPPRQERLNAEYHQSLRSALVFGELSLTGAGGYAVQPRASIGFIAVAPKRSFSLALGVTPVFPRQYELDLPFETPVPSLVSATESLFQSGNGALTPEEQYTGAAEIRLGSPDKQLALSVTGGKIVDGINWRTSSTTTGLLYSPLNEDFTFVGVTLSQRYPITSWLNWNGSAAYYNADYDSTAQPTYAPEYNLFTGLTLDFYFRPLEMHISGYGELTYVGDYLGNDGSQLGQQAVVNYRASFRIKDFTFNYIFENALSAQYQAREQYTNIGRYSWYWITWNFFN